MASGWAYWMPVAQPRDGLVRFRMPRMTVAVTGPARLSLPAYHPGKCGSHAPDGDGNLVGPGVSAKDAGFPGSAGAQVEDREVAPGTAASIHAVGGLQLFLGDHGFQPGLVADDLALDDALHGAGSQSPPGQRPFDDEVGAPAGDGVLASDAAAALDDAVEVGLQDELRAGLAVPVAVDPCLGVFPEVGLEPGEQLGEVEGTVGADIPGGDSLPVVKGRKRLFWDSFQGVGMTSLREAVRD